MRRYYAVFRMKLVNRVLRLRPQLGPVSRAGSGPALVFDATGSAWIVISWKVGCTYASRRMQRARRSSQDNSTRRRSTTEARDESTRGRLSCRRCRKTPVLTWAAAATLRRQRSWCRARTQDLTTALRLRPSRTKTRQNESPAKRNPDRTKSHQNDNPSERKPDRTKSPIWTGLQ